MISKVIAILVLSTILTTAAWAQTGRPIIEPIGTFGLTSVVDDGAHILVGGSLRVYVSSRLGIEPELMLLNGPNSDRDVTFIPHVTYDFGDSLRVRPYAIGGIGVLHHTNKFLGVSFSNNEWTMSAGAGAKFFLNNRLFLAPELRLGYKPIFRAAIGIGYGF